jgi:hypothetical protein
MIETVSLSFSGYQTSTQLRAWINFSSGIKIKKSREKRLFVFVGQTGQISNYFLANLSAITL